MFSTFPHFFKECFRRDGVKFWSSKVGENLYSYYRKDGVTVDGSPGWILKDYNNFLKGIGPGGQYVHRACSCKYSENNGTDSLEMIIYIDNITDKEDDLGIIEYRKRAKEERQINL